MNDKQRNTIECETETPSAYPAALRVRTHTFRADVGPSIGGSDSAPGAHDFFDAALAACKTHTAFFYARRHSIPLERVHVHVERDDSEERRGMYRLRLRIELDGPMTDDQRAAVKNAISACPIHKLMTTSEVSIETE
jgi:putative redox protein